LIELFIVTDVSSETSETQMSGKNPLSSHPSSQPPKQVTGFNHKNLRRPNLFHPARRDESKKGQAWWFSLVILATWEVEIGRIAVGGQPRQNV
jgi:hypothetical protein